MKRRSTVTTEPGAPGAPSFPGAPGAPSGPAAPSAPSAPSAPGGPCCGSRTWRSKMASADWQSAAPQVLVARYPKKSSPEKPGFELYETRPEFRNVVPTAPLSGAFEMEKLAIGSPPLAQLRRSGVSVACGTDWERLEQTGF